MSIEKLGVPRAESGTYRLTRQLEHTSGTTRRGRPPGSKSKTAIIPSEDIQDYIDKVDKVLSKDDVDYLVNTMSGKEDSSLERDLDIILGLNMKVLIPILAKEATEGKLNSEGTRRVSAVKEMLNLKLQLAKVGKSEDVDNVSIIRSILNERETSPEHLAELVGARTLHPDKELPGVFSGNVYDDGRQADEVGTVPDELPERQEQVSTGSEV